jgi:polyhydroxyalkanoate synthesis repressor PhaR
MMGGSCIFSEVYFTMNTTPSSAVANASPITIKKYANRRLYNTATSSYVTLDQLSQMVKDGTDFLVFDAKTNEDITRSVLAQIIVEEESKGQRLLPISFMRQLISLYGDNLQWMVPNYLDYSMQVFSRNQEKIRKYFQDTMSGSFGALEEMSKQNIALFERAMKIFSPFPDMLLNDIEGQTKAGSFNLPSGFEEKNNSLETLRRRLDELQGQLEAIARGNKNR